MVGGGWWCVHMGVCVMCVCGAGRRRCMAVCSAGKRVCQCGVHVGECAVVMS